MLETVWNLVPKRTLGAVVGAVLAAAGYSFAVDSQDHITTDEAKVLKAEGVEMVIMGLTYWSPCSQPSKVNPNANTSLQNLQAVEMRTAGYLLVDPHTSPRESIEKAKRAVAPEVWDKMEWVAVDFEIPAECYPFYRVPVETVYETLRLLRDEYGKCVAWPDGDCKSVLYTSCGEWHSRLLPSNPLKPSRTVLWNASWDGNADIDYSRCQFGGFREDEVLIEQWSGATTIGSVNVDRNTLVTFERPEPKPPVITPPSCGCCDTSFYSREQGLHALASLSGAYALEAFREEPQTTLLHPFDKAVVLDIACQMSK